MPTRTAELTGIVKPETDDRALNRTASEMEDRFQKAAKLAPEIDTSSLRRKLEAAIPGGGLLGGAVDRLTGQGGAAGGGGAGGGPGPLGDQTLQIQAAQLEKLDEIQEAIEKGSVSGGGGLGPGGGGFLGGLIGGGKGSSLSSLAGGVSFGALVSKVSLKSLLTKVPAFATLVTAASLSDELVEGTLGPDDLVESSIKLGEIMTFGLSPNDLVSGTIGAATLIGGTAQIASFISGKLSGTALAGYLGNVGIGTLVNPLTGSLVALLGGVISLGDLVDGDISSWNLPAKFGKALGKGFQNQWPNMADKIHKAFTNNPFYEFGQDIREGFENPNKSKNGFKKTGPNDSTAAGATEAGDGTDIEQGTVVGPGRVGNQLAEATGEDAWQRASQAQQPTGNRARNREVVIPVEDNRTIEVNANLRLDNVREQLRREGIDPDVIEEVARQWPQIQRNMGNR